MAGPRPQDSYSPVAEVSPSGPPSDYLTTRANPNDFGAQVGQATQGLGKTLEGAGNDAIQVAIQAQGLANEHAANQAELELAVKGGEVYNKYKTLEGLDAANQKDQAVQAYLKVNDQIRSSLTNSAAQRAYDQLAARRMSYTIQDINGYAADQTKKAYRDGNNASMNLSIDNASKYSVASDANQLGFEKGNVIFQANAMFTAPIYGKYQTVPATTNKDGTLQFDTSTDQGKIAQADYENYLNTAMGKFYKNSVDTLLNDPVHGNVNRAVDFLEQNKAQMPANVYASLSHALIAPYRNEQARAGTEDILARTGVQYNQTIGSSGGASIVDTFANQESGNGKISTNIGQIQPDTWKQFALPGEDINNPADNRAVMTRMINKYNSDYNGDLPRVAVAYFSGPGNVALEGSQTPWIRDVQDKNGKSVSSYVQDIASKQGGYQTYANYLGSHASELIQQARDEAKANGLDVTGQDMWAQRMEQRISEARSSQQGEVRALQGQILSKVMDEKRPITNVAMLDNNPDPQIKQAWVRLNAIDPWGASAMERRIAANARGLSKSLGTDFYNSGLLPLLSGKVKSPDDLQNYFGGDNSPISASGIRTLEQIHQDMQTPQGAAFAAEESKFLEKAHGIITGSSIFPGINPAARAKEFNKWVATALPQINAMRQDGKSTGEIFGPDSPLTKSVLAPDLATLTKIAQQSQLATAAKLQPQTQAQTQKFDPNTIKTREELIQAMRTHKDFHDNRALVEATAKRLGLVSHQTGPSVPLPNDQ